MTDSANGVNGHAPDASLESARRALTKLNAEMVALGLDQNHRFKELFAANRRLRPALPDGEVLALLRGGQPPPGNAPGLPHVMEGVRLPQAAPGPQQNGPAGGGIVTQGDPETQKPTETQETQETERNSSKSNEMEGVARRARDRPTRQQEEEEHTEKETAEDVPLHLPFPAYVEWACEHNGTMRGVYPEWSELYAFVRAVKSHPSMLKKTGPEAFQAVERVLKAWVRPKEGVEQAWEDHFDIDRDSAESEFMAWDKVRLLLARSPLENALARAQALPLSPAKGAPPWPRGYARFVSLAGWLQIVVGAHPIALPVEAVGETLGVTKMAVSRYREQAVKEQLLKRVRSYKRPEGGKPGRADEFVFAVGCFPILREQAEKGTLEAFDEA